MQRILKEVKNSVEDFKYYDNDRFVFLDKQGLDWRAKAKISYGEWIENKESFRTIKIEGLEENKRIFQYLRGYNIKNIHAFISHKTGFSFKWHKDDVTLILMVLCGFKRVSIKNKVYQVNPGESVIIPRGSIHKVFSKAGTVALSIGLK